MKLEMMAVGLWTKDDRMSQLVAALQELKKCLVSMMVPWVAMMEFMIYNTSLGLTDKDCIYIFIHTNSDRVK